MAAYAIIKQIIDAKIPQHLNKSNNQAHFEKGKYEEEIVTQK